MSYYNPDLISDHALEQQRARRIRDYWKERGHEVTVTARVGPYVMNNRGCIAVVESDLINGLPRAVYQELKAGGRADV